MKNLILLSTLCLTVTLSACGSKKAEEVEITETVNTAQEVKKETYHKITDAKKIIDKANDAVKLIEDSAIKQQKEIDAM